MSDTTDFETKIQNGHYLASGNWRDRVAKKGEFQTDLLANLGLTGHPKAQLLFDLAWEFGHAEGYSEVFTHAACMAELLK